MNVIFMNTLRKKLHLKEEVLSLAFVPEGLEINLRSDLAPTKELDFSTDEKVEAVLIFIEQASVLAENISRFMQKIGRNTIVWFAYPKKSSKKYKSDMSRDNGWSPFYSYEYEPVRQVALDEDWSCLRFKALADIPTREKRMIKE